MCVLSAKKIFLSLLLISFTVEAQEKKDWYTFFGEIPNTVDGRLYHNLKSATDLLQRIKIMDTIANIHMQASNTDSIVYYGELLEDEILANKNQLTDPDFYLSKAYNILGKGKLEQGLFDSAMKYHLEGISISPAPHMNAMHYTHQLGLGIVYLYKEEYNTAQTIFETCLQEAKDSYLQILAKKYLADTFFYKSDSEQAKSYYLEVLSDVHLNQNNKIRLDTQLKLGRIDALEGDLDHAMQYFTAVKTQSLKNNFYDLYIDAVIRIGIVYYNQGHAEDAEIILSSAYVNAVQWNKLELQRDVIDVLRKVIAANGNYKNAYNLVTQYLSISEDILKRQNKKLVKELEVKYQTLQKEKEILSLKEEQLAKESEIERQRTFKRAFLIGFVIILLPVIALLIVYFQKLKTQVALNKSQEEVNSQKIYGLMKDQELNLIKATMKGQDKERKRLARELHDSIGGNLASIKLQLSGDNHNGNLQAKIIDQINETYHEVRDISHNLASKKFQNNGISTLIKEYVNNIQEGSNQNISFNPYPEEEINQIETPLKEELFKIVQELLTNSLKHAKADQIDIYLNGYERSLQLLFEDNGVGFDTSKMVEGIGFKNIKNRLKPLSGTLLVDSTINRGTVVNIEIPV